MYKLMDICSEWMAENGRPENQRSRIYTLGTSCLRELNMDVNGSIKTVQLTINANNTVNLPNDFMRYIKIAVQCADGRLYSLGLDDSISMKASYNACGQQVSNIQNISNNSLGYSAGGGINAWGVWGGAFYLQESIFGGAFGLGGGNNVLGYYRLDRDQNILWLANIANTLYAQLYAGGYLVMEYVSDIESADGDFIVNPFIVETVKAFISWRYVINDRNTNGGEKEMRRREYYNQLRLSNNRYSASTPQEYAAAMRVSNMAAARW